MKFYLLAILTMSLAMPAIAAKKRPSTVILHSIQNGSIVKKRGLQKLIVNCGENNKLIRQVYRDFTKAAKSSFKKYKSPRRVTFKSKYMKNGTLMIISDRSVKLAHGPHKGKKQRLRISIQAGSDCSVAKTL